MFFPPDVAYIPVESILYAENSINYPAQEISKREGDCIRDCASALIYSVYYLLSVLLYGADCSSYNVLT